MSDIFDIRQNVETVERTIAPFVEELAEALGRPISEMDMARINWIRAQVGALYSRIQQSLGQYGRIPRVPQIDPETPATGAQSVRYFQTVRFFEDARHRANSWLRLANLIEQQLEVSYQPLIKIPRASDPVELQHLVVLNEMYRSFHKLANPFTQDPEATEQSFFADIPLAATEFVEYAHAAYRVCLAQRRPLPLRFLDVGCGGGTKVVMAASFFGRTDGLEYDKGYAQAAQATLAQTGPANSQVFIGNALSFDTYADYDVIYFYRPIANEERRKLLEDRIARSARAGTVLIAPFNDFSDERDSLDCQRIAGPIYVTGVDAAAAQALLADAEATGISVPTRDFMIQPQTGYLTPLVLASLANGYVL